MFHVEILLCTLLSLSQGVPHQYRGVEWMKREFDLSHHVVPRIVGGEVVNGREFPAMVSIRNNGSHFCGGSIINEEWIVTAAQCAKMMASEYQVVVGSNKISEGGTTHQVTYLHAHEKYGTTPSMSSDIAVMKVSPKIVMGNGVDVIKLPAKGQFPPTVGTAVTVIGWGATENHGEFSDDLLKIEEPVTNRLTCSNLYDLMTGRPVDADQLCAGGVGGRDSCNGDAGGPLIVDNELIGIVSWGLPCAKPQFPTVHTLVSHFITWINTNISV